MRLEIRSLNWRMHDETLFGIFSTADHPQLSCIEKRLAPEEPNVYSYSNTTKTSSGGAKSSESGRLLRSSGAKEIIGEPVVYKHFAPLEPRNVL